MLTYGSLPQDEVSLEALVSNQKKIDVTDIGENNAYWMSVVRSKKVLELKDKATGKVTRIPIDEHFTHLAEARYHLGPVRIAIALNLVGMKS